MCLFPKTIHLSFPASSDLLQTSLTFLLPSQNEKEAMPQTK